MTRLLIWTVYDHPKDYPDYYVARKFITTPAYVIATDDLLLSKNIEALRKILSKTLICLSRSENDDPRIMETWL